MVANDCSPESFGSFAMAMRGKGVDVDIQVEQLFVSQAAMASIGQLEDDQYDEL